MSQGAARLYGLQERRQTGYLCGAAGFLRGFTRLFDATPREFQVSMDSFELNKILGALLGTCLILLALNITAGAIFAPHKPAKPGYEIAVPETPAGGGPGAPVEPDKPITDLLASSDPAKGENAAKKCAACHTFNKGGPNRVGPNLWGVVERAKGTEGGFNYSAALKGKGGTWTYDDLNKFLASPKSFVPGTNMQFAGLNRASERADVINYLHTLADSPKPLPKAAAAHKQ